MEIINFTNKVIKSIYIRFAYGQIRFVETDGVQTVRKFT